MVLDLWDGHKARGLGDEQLMFVSAVKEGIFAASLFFGCLFLTSYGLCNPKC